MPPSTLRYVELHCHSNFSFLDGTSDPAELVQRAATLGLPALALTDNHGLYGIVRFAAAAKLRADRGEPTPRAIVGAELLLADGERIVLLIRTLAGYRNLCWLIDRAHRSGLPASETPSPTPPPRRGRGWGGGPAAPEPRIALGDLAGRGPPRRAP